MLERHIEIGQQLAFGHQWNDLINMRIRVNVMQACPHAEFTESFAQRSHPRLVVAITPTPRRVFQVNAIGTGVLRDHQQFLDAAFDQSLGLSLIHI